LSWFVVKNWLGQVYCLEKQQFQLSVFSKTSYRLVRTGTLLVVLNKTTVQIVYYSKTSWLSFLSRLFRTGTFLRFHLSCVTNENRWKKVYIRNIISYKELEQTKLLERFIQFATRFKKHLFPFILRVGNKLMFTFNNFARGDVQKMFGGKL